MPNNMWYFIVLMVQFTVSLYVCLSFKFIHMFCGSSKSLALCVIYCLKESVKRYV